MDLLEEIPLQLMEKNLVELPKWLPMDLMEEFPVEILHKLPL